MVEEEEEERGGDEGEGGVGGGGGGGSEREMRDEERGGGTEVRGAGMICISEADVVVCIHKLDKRMDKIKGN